MATKLNLGMLRYCGDETIATKPRLSQVVVLYASGPELRVSIPGYQPFTVILTKPGDERTATAVITLDGPRILIKATSGSVMESSSPFVSVETAKTEGFDWLCDNSGRAYFLVHTCRSQWVLTGTLAAFTQVCAQ